MQYIVDLEYHLAGRREGEQIKRYSIDNKMHKSSITSETILYYTVYSFFAYNWGRDWWMGYIVRQIYCNIVRNRYIARDILIEFRAVLFYTYT